MYYISKLFYLGEADMKIKEKCIYYNPVKEGYYLVLSIDNKMIYGRTGGYSKASNLEEWISQDGPGIKFKINDIIINGNFIRNYYLDEKDLEHFELVKELTDKEFYPMDLLINSRYNFPHTLIDITNISDSVLEEAEDIFVAAYEKEEQLEQLKKDIGELEKKMFALLR